jgi:predicted O-methyltransferase YrrM
MSAAQQTPPVNQSLLPDEYLPHLDELNRIVMESGVPAEGNLYYYHHERNPSRRTVYSVFYEKRCNFATACRDSTHILEIGFNAGHSALLALSCGLEYHGVDIATYPYVRPAAQYLKSVFGDRFHLYEGDSLKVLPQLPVRFPYLRFNLIHIDGDHSHVKTDTANARKMALNNAWIIIDDTNMEGVPEFYESQIASGSLIRDRPQGWTENKRHAIARIPPIQ